MATILLFAFRAHAQNPEQLAQQAAKAYNNKQYPEAINLYEKIVSAGYESAGLYYNLGNAYFRTNEMAPAVWYFEKALKIEPNNDNIKNNIDVVNSKLADKVETVPELFYKKWWKGLVNYFTLSTMAILNIVFLTISLILIALYISLSQLLFRKIAFWSGLFFFIFFCIGSIAASQRNHYINNEHQAIVFEPTVNIKSSPDENSKEIFVLHEGTKVTLLDVVADWQEIKIANGSIGWIRSSYLRKI